MEPSIVFAVLLAGFSQASFLDQTEMATRTAMRLGAPLGRPLEKLYPSAVRIIFDT
jgi:hypothetical protein